MTFQPTISKDRWMIITLDNLCLYLPIRHHGGQNYPLCLNPSAHSAVMSQMSKFHCRPCVIQEEQPGSVSHAGPHHSLDLWVIQLHIFLQKRIRTFFHPFIHSSFFFFYKSRIGSEEKPRVHTSFFPLRYKQVRPLNWITIVILLIYANSSWKIQTKGEDAGPPPDHNIDDVDYVCLWYLCLPSSGYSTVLNPLFKSRAVKLRESTILKLFLTQHWNSSLFRHLRGKIQTNESNDCERRKKHTEWLSDL